MKFLFIIMAFLLTACSVKNYKQSVSKVIIIKSPKIKFADLGYIRNSKNSVELELFIAGRSFKKITINHLICTDEGCMTKSGFNSDYLSSSYEDSILQNILLGKKIFNGKNLVKLDDGFIQNIKTKDLSIKYKVTNKLIYFKDKKNNILIKIKDGS